MKMINGRPCKQIKTAMGHKLWVQMTDDELLERDLYHLTVVLVPALLYFAFVCASGILW